MVPCQRSAWEGVNPTHSRHNVVTCNKFLEENSASLGNIFPSGVLPVCAVSTTVCAREISLAVPRVVLLGECVWEGGSIVMEVKYPPKD